MARTGVVEREVRELDEHVLDAFAREVDERAALPLGLRLHRHDRRADASDVLIQTTSKCNQLL